MTRASHYTHCTHIVFAHVLARFLPAVGMETLDSVPAKDDDENWNDWLQRNVRAVLQDLPSLMNFTPEQIAGMDEHGPDSAEIKADDVIALDLPQDEESDDDDPGPEERDKQAQEEDTVDSDLEEEKELAEQRFEEKGPEGKEEKNEQEFSNDPTGIELGVEGGETQLSQIIHSPHPNLTTLSISPSFPHSDQRRSSRTPRPRLHHTALHLHHTTGRRVRCGRGG